MIEAWMIVWFMCMSVSACTRSTNTGFRICGVTGELVIEGFMYSEHSTNPKLACKEVGDLLFLGSESSR